jgi:hypothetical protein
MGVAVMLGSLALSGCGSSFQGALNDGSGGSPTPTKGEPQISAISPATVIAGGPSFTITVTGKNFESGDTVEWDTTALASTFVSSTQMTAQVPNQAISHATSATIVVQRLVRDPLTFGATINITAPPSPGTAGFTMSTVSVEANDMVWDPGSQQIYLSLGGTNQVEPNSITALNPLTGQFGVSVPAGSGADRLGVSSDGSWLYAGIDKDGSVQRFALPSLVSDITIPLGSGSQSRPYYAVDIENAPGSPNTIAVSRATSAGLQGSVVIYDGSTPRPASLSSVDGYSEPLWSLAWNTSNTSLYGAFNQTYSDPFVVFSVNSTGLQLVQSSPPLSVGGVHYSALTGYVYGDTGPIFDPATGSAVNRLPLAAVEGGFAYSSPLLTLDDKLGMAWILGQPSESPNQQYTIEAFDLRTYALLGSIAIPNVAGTPVRFIRWGTNGLAFLTNGTSSSQGDGVYIVSGAFVTTPSMQVQTPIHLQD